MPRSRGSSGSDGDWDDWASENGDAPAQSFLGSHVFPTVAEAWEELAAATGFDFAAARKAQGWDAYVCVRLVNYLRKAAALASAAGSLPVADVLKAATAAACGGTASVNVPGLEAWDAASDAWLVPVLEGDAIIMDVVGEEEEGEDAAAGGGGAAAGGGAGGATGGAAASAPASEVDKDAVIARLQAELEQARRLLKAAVADDDSDSEGEEGAATSRRAGGAREEAEGLTPGTTSKGITGQDNDAYYFDSYANLGIHSDMLKDKIRTDAYRDAILRNPGWVQGKAVLDLGCGSGILSMFSAKAGAKKVIAVDASGVLEDARANIAANGLDRVITCVKGKAEELDWGAVLAAALPEETSPKVDILVSEWMGYALLYECMLNSVLYVRDRVLAPGTGRMLPSRASIHVAGVSDTPMWQDRVEYWKNVYGFVMSPMLRHVFHEPYVEVLPAGCIATTPAAVADFNLAAMRASEQDLLGVPFKVIVTSQGIVSDASSSSSAPGSPAPLHGLALWFDIGFHDELFAGPPGVAATAGGAATTPSVDSDDLPPLETEGEGDSSSAASPTTRAPYHPVDFTTGAHGTPTHWRQTLFLFQEPLDTVVGDVLTGKLTMVRDAVNPREYRFVVEASVEGGATARKGATSVRQTYHMR